LALLGDDDGARAARGRADGIAPATALDYFEAALASYRAGQLKEAAAACDEALQLQPDHFWAEYVRALCNLQEQRWAQAKVGLTVCLRRRPDYPWPLAVRGMAYLGLEKFDEAERDFADAWESWDDPAFRASVLTNRSALRLRQRRPDDAEDDLREAIRLLPRWPQGHVNLAEALWSRGDLDAAVAPLDRALGLRPAPALYARRARLHALRGDPASARRDFRLAIDKDPTGGKSDLAAGARVELAHLRLEAAKHAGAAQARAEREAALTECDAVLAVRPDFADAHLQRAQALLALKKDDQAAAALDGYLAAGGKPTPRVYRDRALLYVARGKYGPAVDAYTAALLLLRKAEAPAQRRQKAEVLTLRGHAYLLQSAARSAQADFEAALELEPRDADALAGLGLALTTHGRPADVPKATAAAAAALRQGRAPVPRLMTCARTYARAAGVFDAEPRRPAYDAEAAEYRQTALALVRQALAETPEKDRAALWRDGILTDPALVPLRRMSGMAQLDNLYGR
jgi:tetratricopeptide (TPR) repeat protein